MATIGHEIRQELERSLEELQTIRDELRVKVHLAGMEAKDKWKELEPNLEHAEDELKDAARKFRDALADLKSSFGTLRDKLP
jgi:F0F1-type ATP synthase membrane subunit b/b'